jgi:phage-related protein (TIGR01555 family)
MKSPQLLNLDESAPTPDPFAQKSHRDGWTNMVSGMGTRKDKSRYTTYAPDVLLPLETLAALYTGDGLAASIIDIFADDLTREWGCVEDDPEGEDGLPIIATAMEKLDVKSAFNSAEKWARLFGGALAVIGVIDGRTPETPLNLKSIRSIEYIKVIDIGDILISQCTYNTDLTSSEYGNIDTYAINYRIGNEYVSRRVHASRCIPFFGKKVPTLHGGANVRPEMRYWGMSELQPIWSYLRSYQDAFGSVSSVLNELVIGKYKFSDLDEMLAEDNGARFKARMEAIEMMKSTINGVMLGTDEDYLRDTVSLTGIPDTLDRFMMNVSAVTRYPVTKLFGRSPAGMNATGENDLKNYYDSVRARQNAEWSYVQMLVNMIAAWKGVKEYTPFKWNPLFQLTEEQEANVDRIEAETYRTQADADERYMNAGVLMPEEVYAMRFEDELGPKDSSEFEDMNPEPLPPGLGPNGEILAPAPAPTATVIKDPAKKATPTAKVAPKTVKKVPEKK